MRSLFIGAWEAQKSGPQTSCVLSLWLNVLLLDVNWVFSLGGRGGPGTDPKTDIPVAIQVTHQALSHVMRVCTEPSRSSCSTEKGHSQTHSYTQSEFFTETTHRVHTPVFQRFSRVVDKLLGECGVRIGVHMPGRASEDSEEVPFHMGFES